MTLAEKIEIVNKTVSEMDVTLLYAKEKQERLMDIMNRVRKLTKAIDANKDWSTEETLYTEKYGKFDSTGNWKMTGVTVERKKWIEFLKAQKEDYLKEASEIAEKVLNEKY